MVRFGARDYLPSMGRWVSKDEARLDGGLNLYAYADNDPVNLVDLSGNGPVGYVVGGLAGTILGGVGGLIVGGGEGLLVGAATGPGDVLFGGGGAVAA